MMESEGGDSMVWARQRIKELENAVAALTEKIEVVEAKNLLLEKLLANLEEDRSKASVRTFENAEQAVNCVEIDREVISGVEGKGIILENCQEGNFGKPCSSHVTPDDTGPVFEMMTGDSDKDRETYGFDKTPPSGDFLTMQIGLERDFEASRDAQKDTTLEMQVGPVTAEGGAKWSQPDQVSRKVKKGKMGAVRRNLQNQVTRHVALKIMYLGSRYHGFASQGGSQKTVESELFAALKHTKLLISDRAEANYSRCGRTDKGVSAVGQLIALQLRSKFKTPGQESGCKMLSHDVEHVLLKSDIADNGSEPFGWDRVTAARASRSSEEYVSSITEVEDEIDYVGVLNRVLPEDIRVLGWCSVPRDFNARFSCLYREYKYFFISEGLNVDAMKLACSKFLGDHDFRNFCKMDAANVHNYRRTVSTFEILPVNESWAGRQVWVMRIRGTAFLWHQVRCMAAVLFMVGEGYESPKIVDDLLDVGNVTRKPQYIMASELPLVLHTCGFQGLTLHCPPKAARHLQLHLNNVMEQTLVQLALLQEAVSELPRPVGVSDEEKHSKSRKQHTPLLRRLTEPSYEERRGGKA